MRKGLSIGWGMWYSKLQFYRMVRFGQEEKYAIDRFERHLSQP